MQSAVYCRREGMKLFLKGAKCFSDKCPIEKRNFAPGQHGKDRKAKIVGYGLQVAREAESQRNFTSRRKASSATTSRRRPVPGA